MKMTKTRFNEGLLNCISSHIYELRQHIPDNEELIEASYVIDYEESAENEGWTKAKTDGWLLKEPLQVWIPMKSSDDDMWREVERLVKEANPTADEDDMEYFMEEADYELVDKGEWIHIEDSVYSMIEEAQELCENYNIDPYEREVYEHWLVDRYLASWLINQGEKVIDVLGLQDVWCRTCTGQMCYMDFNIDQDS